MSASKEIHGWLPDDEIIGEIEHQEVVTEVEINRLSNDHPNTYHVKANRRSTRADVLNMATSAAGMAPDSTLHLGGDRAKRVTHTRTSDDRRYVYVEVGERV